MIGLSALFEQVRSRPQEPIEAYRARKAVEHAELRAEMERRNAERLAERLRRDCGLGDRFRLRTFETWRPSLQTADALEVAKAAATGKRGLWLHGRVGCGKTHLAAAIVNAALDANFPAMFTTGVALLERLRKSYDDRGSVHEGQDDVIARYASVPVLALDDLGKERFTAWAAEQLWELVNRRYESGQAVIVTSNVAPLDLAAHWARRDIDPHLGESICRRLAEMTGKPLEIL